MKQDNQNAESVEGWLKLSEKDYQTAKILADGELAFYDNACFHCQQAVEKFLKAISIYHSGKFKKIHDLKILTDDVKKLGVDPGFSREEIDRLDTYYTNVRYVPDAEVDKKDAVGAIEIVEKVKRFVEHEAGLEGIKFDKSWWESV